MVRVKKNLSKGKEPAEVPTPGATPSASSSRPRGQTTVDAYLAKRAGPETPVTPPNPRRKKRRYSRPGPAPAEGRRVFNEGFGGAFSNSGLGSGFSVSNSPSSPLFPPNRNDDILDRPLSPEETLDTDVTLPHDDEQLLDESQNAILAKDRSQARFSRTQIHTQVYEERGERYVPDYVFVKIELQEDTAIDLDNSTHAEMRAHIEKLEEKQDLIKRSLREFVWSDQADGARGLRDTGSQPLEEIDMSDIESPERSISPPPAGSSPTAAPAAAAPVAAAPVAASHPADAHAADADAADADAADAAAPAPPPQPEIINEPEELFVDVVEAEDQFDDALEAEEQFEDAVEGDLEENESRPTFAPEAIRFTPVFTSTPRTSLGAFAQVEEEIDEGTEQVEEVQDAEEDDIEVIGRRSRVQISDRVLDSLEASSLSEEGEEGEGEGEGLVSDNESGIPGESQTEQIPSKHSDISDISDSDVGEDPIESIPKTRVTKEEARSNISNSYLPDGTERGPEVDEEEEQPEDGDEIAELPDSEDEDDFEESARKREALEQRFLSAIQVLDVRLPRPSYIDRRNSYSPKWWLAYPESNEELVQTYPTVVEELVQRCTLGKNDPGRKAVEKIKASVEYWPLWGEIWETICEYQKDSFAIFVVFAAVFGDLNVFFCHPRSFRPREAISAHHRMDIFEKEPDIEDIDYLERVLTPDTLEFDFDNLLIYSYPGMSLTSAFLSEIQRLKTLTVLDLRNQDVETRILDLWYQALQEERMPVLRVIILGPADSKAMGNFLECPQLWYVGFEPIEGQTTELVREEWDYYSTRDIRQKVKTWGDREIDRYEACLKSARSTRPSSRLYDRLVHYHDVKGLRKHVLIETCFGVDSILGSRRERKLPGNYCHFFRQRNT